MSKGRLFITGGAGFTGMHLTDAATGNGWEVKSLEGNLEEFTQLEQQIADFAPNAIIHLAAISAVTHADSSEIYRVNVIGTENLLKAIAKNKPPLKKIVLASSAAVYGNSIAGLLAENLPPAPVSHYGISKLAMEFVAATFYDRLPIVIARPFNYTGVGHDERFVVPKIVGHFLRKSSVIELGDLEVEREFNDVRFVVEKYLALLDYGLIGQTYNVCSGRPIKLQTVIDTLIEMTGLRPSIQVNPTFIRENEVRLLAGSPIKLNGLASNAKQYPLVDTIRWMVDSSK